MTDWSHTDPMVDEPDGSPCHGLYVAILMEATAVALVWFWFRLGGLLLAWACQ